jgi:hypothetical protein
VYETYLSSFKYSLNAHAHLLASSRVSENVVKNKHFLSVYSVV